MSQNDPTDNALAAIASILDGSEGRSTAPSSTNVEDDSISHGEADIDGYSKSGPGPLDSIRFKWTARRDNNGNYFVDETVGNTSRVISTGPMPGRDAVKLIDERERVARARFEGLRNEINTGLAAQPSNSDHDG